MAAQMYRLKKAGGRAMLQISSLRTPASRLQLNLNYSYPAGAPAFRAWAAALAWAAVLGHRAWAAVLACQAWAAYPGSGAYAGSDLLVNRESCDVEFPFANSPYTELWGLEAGKGY
jgi:hypothetical protein